LCISCQYPDMQYACYFTFTRNAISMVRLPRASVLRRGVTC
jgi:hypothetical protein